VSLERKKRLERRAPITRERAEHRQQPKKRQPRGNATFDREVRAQAAARAGGLCECCGRQLQARVDQAGDTVWVFDAHHRQLRSQGGPDTVENCAVLAHDCHMWMHEHPAEAQRRGFIVPRWHDPGSWALILHDGRTVRLAADGTYDVAWDDADTTEGGAA